MKLRKKKKKKNSTAEEKKKKNPGLTVCQNKPQTSQLFFIYKIRL
jgi:hypothetical protein